MLGEFLHSGHVADVILLFMLVEFVFLRWRSRSRRRPGATADLLFAIAPGVCLALALRAALTGSSVVWILAPLAASLPVHLVDMARRRL